MLMKENGDDQVGDLEYHSSGKAGVDAFIPRKDQDVHIKNEMSRKKVYSYLYIITPRLKA